MELINPFFSICIPAYNRPNELLRLLKSIDASPNDIEIVICEDKSTLRQEIVSCVESFKKDTLYNVRLILNEKNLGYDANLRECIKYADGEYIFFMGDDDLIVPKKLDKFLRFVKGNSDLGYILKSHKFIHKNGNVEYFRYFNNTRFFDKGKDTLFLIFRKSVLISGFCIKKKYCLPHLIKELDGTLLFQLYLLSEVVLQYPSAYYDIPIVYQDENLRGIPFFGSSESEKELYTPGVITVENSINFMKGYLKVSKYIDLKYNINFTENLIIDLSKYSYPILSIQRERGVSNFIKYSILLEKEIEINKTFYFYIYYYGLLILGKKKCDIIIQTLKKLLKITPKL